MRRLTRFCAPATMALALALPAGVTATEATAATGPVTATTEEAGYQFSGAQFRYAQVAVYLRNASQYGAYIGGLGQSVQLWTNGSVSFPAGHYVQEKIYYDNANGDLSFTVNDLTAPCVDEMNRDVVP